MNAKIEAIQSETVSLTRLLGALRAAGESTRLRLLAILARTELTVSELTRILGQSQPRVSRHLKLLGEADLLHRYQEGSWVLYRLADTGPCAHIAAELVSLLPDDDPDLLRDRRRLDAVRQEHAQAAARYFEQSARSWDDIRRLYVAEEDVERAMLDSVRNVEIGLLVDLGTGTGRILEIFSPHVQRGVGIDLSRQMLNVARAKLDSASAINSQVRYGDIYDPPLEPACADVVTIHHVLHFLDDPATVVGNAVRLLKPGGRLLIVDFAPHHLEVLRTDHAHRRLGFADEEVKSWLARAGAGDCAVQHLTAAGAGVDDAPLVVTLWVGRAGG